MSKKIMQIAKKADDGTYTSFLPFGAYGENVQMHDLNSLEEELKIGGGCKTSFISDDDGNMTIIAEYAKGKDESYYKVVTTFTSNNDTMTIEEKLYLVDKEENEKLIKSKVTSFESDEDSNNMIITEEVTK